MSSVYKHLVNYNSKTMKSRKRTLPSYLTTLSTMEWNGIRGILVDHLQRNCWQQNGYLPFFKGKAIKTSESLFSFKFCEEK